MRFTKMHGLGNDYVYVDCTDGTLGGDKIPALNDTEGLGALSERISHRHFSIGADGLILVCASEIADFKMRMFNADGSEGRMCGNGARCVGKFVYDHKLTDKTQLTLETLSGVKYLTLHIGDDGKVASVTIDMGEPIFAPCEVPVVAEGEKMVEALVEVDGEPFGITAVSMGNPHGIIFVDEVTDRHVHGVGPKLEVHPMWPDRANIEFARVISPSEIEMRVWERGSGETMACGTGTCATAVAAALTGRADREVTVHLLGGDLHIRWDEATNRVFMTGPATTVFEGVY